MLLDHSRERSLPLWREFGVRFQRVVVIKVGDLDETAEPNFSFRSLTADLHLQFRFFHERLLPNSGYEFVFSDILARALDQSGQDQRRGCLAALASRPRAGASELQRAGTGQRRSRVHTWAAYRVPYFTQFYLTRAARLRGCNVEERSQPPQYSGSMEIVEVMPSAAVLQVDQPVRAAGSNRGGAALACQRRGRQHRTECGSRAAATTDRLDQRRSEAQQQLPNTSLPRDALDEAIYLHPL
jgi:hypothetical protein